MKLKPNATGKGLPKPTSNRVSRLRLVFVIPAGLFLGLLLYMPDLPRASANDQTLIYGVNKEQDVAEVDLSSGTVTIVGTLSFGTQAADQQASTGYVYYFDRTNDANRFAYWDPTTHTNMMVVTYPQPLGFYPKRAAFDTNGQLYMMDATDKLYSVETADGAITELGQVTGLRIGGLGGTGDMAFAPDNTLYVATYRNLYTVDLNTRVATLKFANMLSASGSTVWTGLAYCDANIYASAESLNPAVAGIYRIDPATGAQIRISPLDNILLNDLTSCPPAGSSPTTTPPATTPTVTPSDTPDLPTATATPSATITATPEDTTPTMTPSHTPDLPTVTSTSTATFTETTTATSTMPAATPTKTPRATAVFSPTPKNTRVLTVTPVSISTYGTTTPP